MAWKVEISPTAARQISKLGHEAQRKIFGFLTNEIYGISDPRRYGKALQGDKKGLWRYRIGDYRLICDLHDKRLVVLVLIVGHPKDV